MNQAALEQNYFSKNSERKLHFELVNILFNQVKSMLWAESFAASLILFVLWWNGHYEHKNLLLGWYIAMIVFTGIPRFSLASAYLKSSPEEKQSKHWETQLLILLLISGLGWSLAGTLLLPENNILNQAFVLFLLIGVAAAANPFYSPLREGYAIFLVPILFLTAFFLLFKGTNFYIFTGLGLMCFGMLMLITSVISSGLIANTLKLNFQNDELTKNLIKTNKTLEHLATTDMLTGLANRQSFTEKLMQAISDANQNQKAFALLFLDLDKFKQVNDTLGHDAGDDLLKITAQRLTKMLRPDDELGRLGGDEFLILLKDVDDEKAIVDFAEKLQQIFQAPIMIHGKSFSITTSVGITLFPKDGSDAHKLIKNADSAMYQIKNARRGSYQFY